MADALQTKDYVSRYHSIGEQRFYRDLLHYAVTKIISINKGEYKGTSPELEFLDYSERFLFLYRRESEDTYLELSKVFRKAGHKMYRIMLKKGMTPRNAKFLNLV